MFRNLDNSDFVCSLFLTEHGTLFTGTLNPFRQKSLIYSKSFKQPSLREVYTSLMDQSSFFDGECDADNVQIIIL